MLQLGLLTKSRTPKNCVEFIEQPFLKLISISKPLAGAILMFGEDSLLLFVKVE